MSIYRLYDCSGNMINETRDIKKAHLMMYKIKWLTLKVEWIAVN